MTRKKRNYTRLAPSIWSEICALWEIGDVTLPELAERYSVNARTLQAHFAKHKVVKGSKAASLAASVKKEIYSIGLGDKDHTIQQSRQTRERAYKNSSRVEELIMVTVEAMQKDRSIGLTSKLKALALAAAGLERIHGLKFRALGLDKQNALPDEMPVLIFRDLSKDDLEELHKRDETDEESDLGIPIAPTGSELVLTGTESDDSDDIIEEGREIEDDHIVIEGEGVVIDGCDSIVGSDEREEPAKPRPKTLDTLGGRLVKEALR